MPPRRAGSNWTRWIVAAAAALVFTLCASRAAALINLTFTPVQMARQSTLIVSLEIGPLDEQNQLPVRVLKTVKGELAGHTVAFDLSQTSPNRIQEFRESLGDQKRMALLFVSSEYRGLGDTGGDKKEKGYLHAGHTFGHMWYPLNRDEKGRWQLAEGETQLHAVWAGGTEMLLRATEWALADPGAALPGVEGIAWGTHIQVARIAGKVCLAAAVDLKNNGQLCLFVASDRGDRLFQCAAKTENFSDITAATQLASKSCAAAWGQFAGGARPALASWDGHALTLWLPREDGTFAGRPAGVELKHGCLGLAAVDVNVKGRAGILVSTPDGPMVLTPREDGAWTAAELPAAPEQGELGETGACVVADFDGDGLADILQPFSKGSVLRRGARPGGFEAPKVLREIAAGPGRPVALAGDFAGDGSLDVVTASSFGWGFFSNDGQGKFCDTFEETGEVRPKAQGNAVGGAACDFNTDGCQDLLLLHSDSAPQFHFGRGFRCFGAATGLGFEEKATIPDAARAQQAGVMADFNGTGAQSLALVLASGDLWVVFRAAQNLESRTRASQLGLTVYTGPSGPVGPTTVIGYDGKRCLGARVVAPGTPGFFGKARKGPLHLEWRTRNGDRLAQTAIVLEATSAALSGGR